MSAHGRVVALLLAAGGSRRMRGADKLLQGIDGESLLRRSARAALASGVAETLVVLGANAQARRAALQGLDLRTVTNAHWSDGMGGSLATGIATLPGDADGVLVLLADMPEVDKRVIDDLVASFDAGEPDTILRPVAPDGTPGNPVLFGAMHFDALARLSGDEGARSVISANAASVRGVPMTDEGVLCDLDTPEAWENWRRSREN